MHTPTRPAFAGLAVLLLSALAPAADGFPDAKHKAGELKHVNGVPVLTVRGTPAEIGEQFGVLAIKNAPGLDELHKNFLRDARLEARWGLIKIATRRLKPGFPADHLAEVEAAVKASERELEFALFANTVYDLSSGMGCSTIVVEKGRSKSDGPLFGRNFDWVPTKGITEHTLIAVFHPTGKRAFATVTVAPIAGCISGMNDAGLCLTINEIRLKQSKDAAGFDWAGTPTLLAFRRVLEECGTVAEAEKLLRDIKRTTSACLTVCDKDVGAVFEITPKTFEVRSAVNDVCLCTNHFRTDPLCTGKECKRYETLAALQNPGRKIGVADVFAELDKVNQGPKTLQAMVFEPAAKTLHLKYGAGNATKLEAKTFDLGKMFEVK